MSDVKIDYKGEQVTVHFDAHRIESFSAPVWYKPGNGHMYNRNFLESSHPHSWDAINEYIMSPEGQEAIFYASITGVNDESSEIASQLVAPEGLPDELRGNAKEV